MKYSTRALFFGVFTCAALICAGCTPSAETEPPPPAEPVTLPLEAEVESQDGVTDSETYKIVMLGDSLTAGFGLSPSQALPERLEDRLNAAGHQVEIVNAGVSGDTSAGGLARYDWSVGSVQPDLLILALGANDYLSGRDPAQTRTNLSQIIERAQADEMDILLVSLSSRSSAEDDPHAVEFAAIYPSLAAAYRVPIYEGLGDPIFD